MTISTAYGESSPYGDGLSYGELDNDTIAPITAISTAYGESSPYGDGLTYGDFNSGTVSSAIYCTINQGQTQTQAANAGTGLPTLYCTINQGQIQGQTIAVAPVITYCTINQGQTQTQKQALQALLNPVISMRQYDNSPIMQKVLQFFSGYFDISAVADDVYKNCLDISTCKGFWLDVWGRKVGIDRFLLVPSNDSNFGFDETGHDWQPFNQAPFYSYASTQVYSMPDNAYRLMIMVKALANISDCSAKSLNGLFQIMFAGRGACYVVDNYDMTVNYVFNFSLAPWEKSILNGGLLPRPAGVNATIVFL